MFKFSRALNSTSTAISSKSFSLKVHKLTETSTKLYQFKQNCSSFSTNMENVKNNLESAGPIEKAIFEKFTEAFRPEILEIKNDSNHHKHHAAMKDSESAETHFSVKIISDAFKGMKPIQRQRACFALLDKELNTPGMVHALSLVTRTAEEESRKKNSL